MICMTLNIQKRLYKALSPIQMILSQYNIDVLFLQEVDIRVGEVPPMLDGYESFHHTNSAGVIRVITYIKSHFAATKLAWDEDMPVVIIKLRNVTLINLYNEFTLHSYTNESTKLTERQQLDQVRKSIENTSHIGKRVYWIGDVNIDLINSPLANSFIIFCDSKWIKIENWNATRDKARPDHILNMRT